MSRARNTLPDSTPTWPTGVPQPSEHAPETCPEPCSGHPKVRGLERPSGGTSKHALPGIPQVWPVCGIPRNWSIPAIPGMAKLGTSRACPEQASGQAPGTLPNPLSGHARIGPKPAPGHVPEGCPGHARNRPQTVPEGLETAGNGRKRLRKARIGRFRGPGWPKVPKVSHL